MDEASSPAEPGPNATAAQSAPTPQRAARTGWAVLIALVVVAVVVTCVYWPVLDVRNFFSDDYLYVGHNKTVQNPSWESAARFLREVAEPTTVPGYYEPWPMITLMLDCAMGGDGRRGEFGRLMPFRRTALILHVINSVLVGLLVYLIFREPFSAAAVGVLFGVHPLQVESVAWISQRKTLMATLFVLASLVFYVRHAQGKRWGSYAASVALFLLSLMSKPTALPLPVLLVIMDVWPLRRLSVRTLIEKIPYFALALVSGIISMTAMERTAFIDTPAEVGWGRALLILCHNIVFYLEKIFWPSDLSAYYPFPEPMSLSHPAVLAGVIGTIVLTIALVVTLRWTWAFVAGWAFFFVAIFPAMGVFKVTIVIAADRYVYLPIIGLGLTLGWVLTKAWRRAARSRQADQFRAGLVAVVAFMAIGLSLGTRDYLDVWRDNESIFRHMVRLGPDQVWIRNGLANALIARGRFAESAEHFQAVVDLKPDYIEGYQHLAAAWLAAGDSAKAMHACERALEHEPDSPGVRASLAAVFNQTGRFADAVNQAKQAIEAQPDSVQGHYQLGVALAKLGKLDEAITHLGKAVELKPSHDKAHFNLAAVLARKGDLVRATEACRRAAELDPKDVRARNLLGQLLKATGKHDEAKREFRAVLELNPHHTGAKQALRAYGALGQHK